MSKLKIGRGASKIRWTLLKTNIEATIASDIDLLCRWSDNERKYIINELLRFALSQSEEFQKYKAGSDVDITRSLPIPASSSKTLEAESSTNISGPRHVEKNKL